MNNVFFYTNHQKVLKCLVENNKEALTAQTIQSLTKISKAGVYLALRNLISSHLVSSHRNGQILYKANIDHPIVKQFKIFNTVFNLFPTIKKLSLLADKIILFGSVSRGEDLPDSDVDLFIISRNKEELNKLITSLNKKIKVIIKNQTESQDFSRKEPAFYAEISKGMVLFEKNDEY